MEWSEAQEKILASVKVGTDLNTASSKYRFVKKSGAMLNSRRYGYRQARGFVVQIGKSAHVNIPWSMLETCFTALASPDGYDGEFFRSTYPRQTEDHPCHVHEEV